MEAQERVLDFSSDAGRALAANQNVLREILECSICNSLMLDPYALPCGHAFCGNCLLLWIREREDSATCPQCRSRILSEPVLNIGLRQLALVVAQSWNQTGEEPQFKPADLVAKETPQFFPNGPAAFPLYDVDDDVYRCPMCSHEVDGNECTNCGRVFQMLEEDRDYESVHGSDASSDVSGGDDYDDLSSFIAEEDEEDGDAAPGPNFAHMLRNRRWAVDDEDDESFVDDEAEDDDDGEDDDGEDDDGEGGDGFDSGMDDSGMDSGMDDSDARNAHDEVDLRSESDDSMLAETRAEARARSQIVDDSDDEIEVVNVRRRAVVDDE